MREGNASLPGPSEDYMAAALTSSVGSWGGSDGRNVTEE